jgi:SPP1 family predicted phage head-tail adaptor
MAAGKYRHRITIRNAPDDSSRDTFGGRTGAGTTVSTVWAQKREIGAKEFVEGRREDALVTVEYVIRYLTGIDETMQVVDDTQVLDIEAVLDRTGLSRELQLMCRLSKETT